MLKVKFELLNHSLLASTLSVVVVVLIGSRSLISITDLHKFLSVQ